MRVLEQTERAFLILGLLFLAISGAAYLDRYISYHSELKHFRELRSGARVNESLPSQPGFRTDLSLWSEKRLAAYQDSLAQPTDSPIAVLRIAKLNLEVPVLEGTSELVLNRAVGHIRGTGVPGMAGNVGIAGHRDGFFRALKDIAVGDSIQLETQSGTVLYTVKQIVIVDPSDTSVLQPQEAASLTLVTCYPFYFVGSAPKRYIVRAAIVSSSPEMLAEQKLPISTAFKSVQQELSPKLQNEPRR